MKKILVLIDEGGSKYHRLILPTLFLDKSKYEVHYFKEDYVIEKVVKNYDIIFINWFQKTKCIYLSLWQFKYGFKIYVDMDDYWILPQRHRSYNLVKQYTYQLEDQMILADKVFVSTPFLEGKCREYNDHIILRKNYLPIDNNQFIIESRVLNKEDKIRIGIIGSLSHYDDWLSIKGQIDKMTKDNKIQDNVEFVVCGYSDDNQTTKIMWDRIVNLFKYKKNGKDIYPTVYKSQPVKSYMNLYRNLDICLAPLENSDFNRAKSELKLFECAYKSVLVISEGIYREKGYDEYCLVDKENSYYDWVKKLLDKDYLNSLKLEYSKKLIEKNEENRKIYELEQFL